MRDLAAACREWMLRLIGTFGSSRRDADLDEELRAHLELAADDERRRGGAPGHASRAAAIRSGGVSQTLEALRDQRGLPWLDDLVRDVRYGVRILAKSPAFTLVSIVSLAIGIGANTAIFSVINAVLLRPLGYKSSDRLVRFIQNIPRSPGASGAPLRLPGMDLVDLDTLRAHTQTLSHVSVIATTTMVLGGSNDAVRLPATQVSPAAFPMLGVPPLLGRALDATDDAPGANPVVVISHGVWTDLFGSDPAIVGRTIRLDDAERAIVGVMPAGFTIPDAAFPNIAAQVWLPFSPPRLPPGARASRPAIGRVKDGITLDAAAAELNAILRPPDNAPTSTPRFELVRVQDMLVGPVKPALLILAAAVGVVLLIACVNVASLLLARMAARERETAVRMALGAGRGRLVRQVLTESVLLSFAGGTAGMAVASGGLRMLRTLAAVLPRRDLGPNMSLPRLDEIAIDRSVLVFTIAVAISTGIVFGLAPALWHSTSRSIRRLDSFPRLRMQGMFVIAEIAMATTLCTGAVLLIGSFGKLMTVNPGYDLEEVLTFQVTVPRRPYTPEQYTTLTEDIAAGLRATAGLRSAGYAMNLPMVAGRFGGSLRTAAAPANEPQGMALASLERPLITAVSHDFLPTLGVRLVDGRGLSERDAAGQPLVMVINRAVARGGLLGDHAVGTRAYLTGANTPVEVVGIVDDVRTLELEQEPVAQVFVDIRQFPPPSAALRLSPAFNTLYYAVRPTTPAAAAPADIRAAIRRVDSQATVDNFATMQQLVSNSIVRRRLYTVLVGFFAAVAATLAAVGIYGVIAYSVARRTREIGIRMALGASRGHVIGLVVGQMFRSTAIGIALGLAGAAAVTRYLGSLLFGVSPLDPRTFAEVAVLFGSIALVAASMPARWATKVEPLTALHVE